MARSSSVGDLSAEKFSQRWAYIEKLVERAESYGPGKAPAGVISALSSAISSLDRDIADSKNKLAHPEKCGWLNALCKYRNSKAAKELPLRIGADQMFQATLKAGMEVYGSASRRMGKAEGDWTAELTSKVQGAEKAMAALEANRKNAAAEMKTALTDLVQTLKALSAEQKSDQQVIRALRGEMSRLVESGSSERDAASKGRSLLGKLEAEVRGEQILERSQAATLETFVTAQLDHDPAFADRGVPALRAKVAAWETVQKKGAAMVSQAGDVAAVLDRYVSALATAAENPGLIDELSNRKHAAAGSLDVATRQLQQDRIRHAEAARSIDYRLRVASNQLGEKALFVSSAKAVVADAKRRVDRADDAVTEAQREVARREKELRDAENSGGSSNPFPGDGSGSGSSNPFPVDGSNGSTNPFSSTSGSSNPFPGGGGSTNPFPDKPDLEELRRKLARATENLEEARGNYRQANGNLQAADRNLQEAIASYEIANTRVIGIRGEARDNDQQLAGYQATYSDAKSRYEGISAQLERAQDGLVEAKKLIGSTPAKASAEMLQFNVALQAFNKEVMAQKVDGSTKLETLPGNLPMDAKGIRIGDISKQIAAKDVTALRAFSAELSGQARARSSKISAAIGDLNRQIDEIIRAETAKLGI